MTKRRQSEKPPPATWKAGTEPSRESLLELAGSLGQAMAKRAFMLESLCRQQGLPLTFDLSKIDMGEALRYIAADDRERAALDGNLIAAAIAKEGLVLSDLEKAQAELAVAEREVKRWEDAFDRYSGNNPNKFQADIRAARRARDIARRRVEALTPRTGA